MSEENENGQEQQQEAEFKPITSQDELNRLIGDRINSVKSKFADYDDLKAKASQLDEIEQANKSELDKERERAEAAEKRATAAERSSLQTRVATEFGVPLEVVHGDDEEQMRQSAQKVLEWRDSGKKSPPPPKSLKSGSSGDGGEGGSRAAAALRQMRGNH